MEVFMGLDFTDQAREEIAAADETNARTTTARFTRRNIPMQHGYFQTPDQLESERQVAQYLKFR